jgi:tRNA threonylcarbamoyladenosine biosynthesis protein TsaB
VDSERFVLAFDTATSIGSVALGHGGAVIARAELPQKETHAARLVPTIAQLLEDGGVDKGELGGVIVGAGPGSFTGVRVAAATAKGFAHALHIPMYAFSSLAAGAVSLDARPYHLGGLPPEEDQGWSRYVLFDARADRVFAACYGGVIEAYTCHVEPHATTVGELLKEVPYAVFLGDGAWRHEEFIRAAGFPVLSAPYGAPTADALIRLHAIKGEEGRVEDPGRWEPDYQRATGAERARGDV